MREIKGYWINKDIESFGFVKNGNNCKIHFKSCYECYFIGKDYYEYERGDLVFFVDCTVDRLVVSGIRKGNSKEDILFNGHIGNKRELRKLLTKQLHIIVKQPKLINTFFNTLYWTVFRLMKYGSFKLRKI